MKLYSWPHHLCLIYRPSIVYLFNLSERLCIFSYPPVDEYFIIIILLFAILYTVSFVVGNVVHEN